MEGNTIYKKMKFEKDTWIGAWNAVAAGVTIGASSELGNHSYAVSDIPANKFSIGNPARF